MQAAETVRVRLERLLQVAACDYELRLDFGQIDRLGSGQIVLGITPQQAAEAPYMLLKGQALHLLGHYLGDSLAWADAARREEAQGKPLFIALWHALEDARVENRMVERWPGTRRAFEATMLPNLGGSLLKLMPVNAQIEMGLYLEGRGYRGAQFRHKVRAALEEVADAIAEGAGGGAPRASFEAMQRIYPVVGTLLRSERGRGRPSLDLQDERQAHRQNEGEAHERGPKAPQAQPPDAMPEIELTDETFTVGVMGRRREFPEWYHPGSAPWFERGLGERRVHPAAVRTDRQTIVEPSRGDLEAYRQMRAEVQREVGFLSQRLTNLLREMAYLRYGGYFRTGKLKTAKLWRQRLGHYRLFEQRIGSTQRALAITLLVDESASMKRDDKYRNAAKAAVLLGETLAQLEVPFEIIGYTTAEFEAQAAMRLGLKPPYEYRTTQCSPLEHRIYKRFDEPYHMVRARLAGIQPRHNNWDEEHLLFAFRRIQARSEQRRMIIVISDGQPNGDADNLIKTVPALERLGCKIIGIGVGGDFVRQIYPDAVVVSTFRQMAEHLLQALAREFHGGMPLADLVLGPAMPGQELRPA